MQRRRGRPPDNPESKVVCGTSQEAIVHRLIRIPGKSNPVPIASLHRRVAAIADWDSGVFGNVEFRVSATAGLEQPLLYAPRASCFGDSEKDATTTSSGE